MRALFIAVIVLPAAALSAQPIETISTLCQAVPVEVFPNYMERRLIGCGEGFPDNLLWHLDRSDSISGALDQTLKRKLTGRGAVVYIADVGGVMRGHDEFTRASGSNVIDGFNADGSPPVSCNDPLAPCAGNSGEVTIDGHGTAVASIVAGRHTGVAPDASIVAVRTRGPDLQWEASMKAVIAHAYDPRTPPFRTAIINMSSAPGYLESPRFEAIMRRMIEGVDANGDADPNGKRFLFVVFNGNRGPLAFGRYGHCLEDGMTALYPSVDAHEIDGLIAVGGLTRDNLEWDGACSGAEVLAPAADMFVASTTAEDHYRARPELLSGTSYSTPYVAGMAARLLEADPMLTPAQLEERLKTSASRVDGLAVPVLVVAPPGPKRRSVRH